MPRQRNRLRSQAPVELEELEPRILLSADLDPLLDPGDQPAPRVQLLDEDPTASSVDTVRHEVAFVDRGVEGYEQLLADLRASTTEGRELEVFLLDGSRDGVEQISEVLAGYKDVDAIHIVSHGSEGAVQLGDTWLSSETLSAYEVALSGWADTLSQEADLLFYGCDLAGGATGGEFVASLAQLTGADGAASDDLTGSAQLGGDWDLEYVDGTVETSVALSMKLQEVWRATLATNAPRADYVALPLAFEENQGQSDE